VNVYRQAALERDITDALAPIRVRRDAETSIVAPMHEGLL
jgi:hypothetical protein